MLRNNKFLLDEDCPMCKIYGGAFIKFGIMDKDSITPYQVFDMSMANNIDMERATSEIALVDTKSGVVTYGIDSMIKIITHGNARFRKLLQVSFIYRILRIVYSFISFNRKVIYIVKNSEKKRACNPPLHKAYRWTYIIFVAIVTALILNRFTDELFTQLNLVNNPYREFAVCFGQIIWQGTAIILINKNKFYDYLGNMSTVSLIGGLLLLPLLWTTSLIVVPIWLLMGYFGLVVSLMLAEHIRRCKLMGISLWATFSWVFYRVVVLMGIILPLITC